MIGHDVKIPKNEDLIALYNEILASDGLSMANFHS